MKATQETDLIRYICNSISQFYIVHGPRSTPLRDKFPTKDTIFSEVHVNNKRISPCAMLHQKRKRRNRQMFRRNRKEEKHLRLA